MNTNGSSIWSTSSFSHFSIPFLDDMKYRGFRNCKISPGLSTPGSIVKGFGSVMSMSTQHLVHQPMFANVHECSIVECFFWCPGRAGWFWDHTAWEDFWERGRGTGETTWSTDFTFENPAFVVTLVRCGLSKCHLARTWVEKVHVWP